MRTLLVYETTHGTTEKCAQRLRGLLDVEPDLIRLRRGGRIDLNLYDTVIIGGSIHAGMMQSRIRNFCAEYLRKLRRKRLSLFICCMEEGDRAQEQFANAFPDELKHSAIARGIFGGEYDFDRMNFFQRAIVRKIKGLNASISNIRDEEIIRFARTVNESVMMKKGRA